MITFLLSLLFLLLIFSYYRRPCTKTNTRLIQTLVRQTARWMVAARQDQNPLIAMLHANYATGYWYALRDVVTDTDIERVSGIDVVWFQTEVQATQEWATQKALAVCPQLGPQSAIARIAGE